MDDGVQPAGAAGVPAPAEEASGPASCSRASNGVAPSPGAGFDGLALLAGALAGMELLAMADETTEFTTSRIHDGASDQPSPSNSPANRRRSRMPIQHIEMKRILSCAWQPLRRMATKNMEKSAGTRQILPRQAD